MCFLLHTHYIITVVVVVVEAGVVSGIVSRVTFIIFCCFYVRFYFSEERM